MKCLSTNKTILRREAIALDLKKYFTGKPCKNGHISERTSSNGACEMCTKIRWKTDKVKKQKKAYNEKNKNDLKEKQRIFYINNKEKINKRNLDNYYKNHEKRKARAKEYREENIEERKIKSKIFRDNNKEKIAKGNKVYREKNKEKIAKQRKEYREKNKEAKNKKDREYYQEHKEEIKQYQREYAKKNNDYINKKGREKNATERGKIIKFTRGTLTRILKEIKQEKQISSVKSLNYTIEEFKENIESKFLDGMTWENHGIYRVSENNGDKVWHIDHVIAVKKILDANPNKNQSELLNTINSLENIQPIWAIDNLKKGIY